MERKKVSCGLYTRVSSRSQLEEDYNSLETQRERLEAYCKSQAGFEVYRVYEDGAYSGDSLNRPALKEMVRDIQLEKINCVLAYKIDRLTRSVKDFHKLMDLFDRYRVKFISITQSFDTQSPMGRLLRNILLDFAQFEREMTADRTRDKMQQRAQRGLWNGGIPPYGYSNQNKRLILNPTEAPRVLFMFHRFAEVPSLAKLKEGLNRRAWYTRSGRPWGKTSIDNILRNALYCGKVRFNDRLYEGIHKPVINEALFQRVQKLRRDQTHAKIKLERTYILRGLLRCGDCGSYMTPHYTRKRRKNGAIYHIPYYRCTKTMHYGNYICRNKHINANLVEEMVVKDLANLSQNENFLNMTVEELNRNLKRKVKPLEKEARSLKKREDEIEAEIDRFVKALGQGRISVGRLEKEIEQREQDRQAVRIQYDEIKQRINEAATENYNAELVREALRDFQAIFHALTPQERAEALQCILRDVVLYPDKLVLNIFELSEFKPGSQKHTEWLPDRNPSRNVSQFFGEYWKSRIVLTEGALVPKPTN